MKKELAVLMSDENSEIAWDVDAINEYTREKCQPMEIPVLRLQPKEWVQIDKDYALTTNPEQPIVVIEVCDGLVFTIDGNHRLYKAVTTNIKHIFAYYLPLEIQKQFINDFDTKTYNRVIKNLIDENIFVKNLF